MASLDWFFVAVLAFFLLLGAWRGLVYEVISLVSWLAAFVCAKWFAPSVAAWLPLGGLGEALRYAIGFVLVFVACIFAGGLLAMALSGLVSAVGLKPVDRALGALFGLVRGSVLLLTAVMLVGMTPLRNSVEWRGALGVRWAEVALTRLKPVLPHVFERDVEHYLPTS